MAAKAPGSRNKKASLQAPELTTDIWLGPGFLLNKGGLLLRHRGSDPVQPKFTQGVVRAPKASNRICEIRKCKNEF
jgi:hypothetical protein